MYGKFRLVNGTRDEMSHHFWCKLPHSLWVWCVRVRVRISICIYYYSCTLRVNWTLVNVKLFYDYEERIFGAMVPAKYSFYRFFLPHTISIASIRRYWQLDGPMWNKIANFICILLLVLPRFVFSISNVWNHCGELCQTKWRLVAVTVPATWRNHKKLEPQQCEQIQRLSAQPISGASFEELV